MRSEVLKPSPESSDALPVENRSCFRHHVVGAQPAQLDVHATAALQRITRWASRALRAPTALVALVDPRDGLVTRASGEQVAAATLALCQRVVDSREPLTLDGRGDPGPTAFVAAALIDRGDRVLGCLCVTDSEPRTWSDHDRELVADLAISATTELELRTTRAMAEREKRWSDGQAAVLELIAARAPLRTALTELLHVAESHAPGMLSSILLLEHEPGGDVLRTLAGPSLPRGVASAIDGVATGEGRGMCATAAARGEPVIVLDIATDPLTAPYVELAAAHGLHAAWSTPILSSGGTVLGTFALYYGPGRLPKPSDEIVIERSIHLARLAIEQRNDARALRHSAKRARALARDQTALQRVATGVAAETDPGVLFGLVAERAGLLLRAERAYVMRFAGEGEALTIGAWDRTGKRGPAAGEATSHDPDGMCARLRRGGGVLRRSVRAGSHPFDERHRIAVPIVVERAPWGMIVALRDRLGAFPRADEKRLARIAQLAGVAVANADARERLSTQALTDPLTGLANRRAFDRRLIEESRRASRHDRPLSLMLIDIDHFKAVNDRFGHAAGDRVLVDLTGALREIMREGDLLARVGGDELAMILGDCDQRQATEVARRMLRAAAGHASLGRGPGVTLSVGVTALRRDESADELLRHADQALYRAKDGGRNRVVCHEEQIAALLTRSSGR